MNWTTLFKKFTNGKYFIGLLTVAFLSIGSFSYAEYQTTNFNNGQYTPSTIVLYEDISKDNLVINYQCNYDECYMHLNDDCYAYYNYIYGEQINMNFCPDVIEAGTYNIFSYEGDNGFDSITLNVGTNQGGNGNGNNIINGGTSNFAPIITKLGNIAGEFIPYMIYIAIGCLGISLAYGALKYILGYFKDKAEGTMGREGMKERRRRRRRNRRFTKSVKNHTY